MYDEGALAAAEQDAQLKRMNAADMGSGLLLALRAVLSADGALSPYADNRLRSATGLLEHSGYGVPRRNLIDAASTCEVAGAVLLSLGEDAAYVELAYVSEMLRAAAHRPTRAAVVGAA